MQLSPTSLTRRSLGFAVPAALCAFAPAVVAAPQDVTVRAELDGRSRLILAGDSATWQHFDFAAPGRLDCDLGDPIQPTFLDGVAWNPTWPDVPTCENRDCGGCVSDTWVGVPTPLPVGVFTPTLSVQQARGHVALVELPSVANGYRTVIEFDDNPIGGDDWYEVTLHVAGSGGWQRYCTSTPNSSGAPARIDFAGSRSVAANDTHLTASGCPAGHAALFFYGGAPASIPFGGGTLCVSPFAPGLFRIQPVQFVRNDGTLDLWLDLANLPPAGAITASSIWHFQLWFRDVGPGGAFTNLSDALALEFVG